MSNAIVSNVYRFVIDDVINQVRGDFEDMGIDDSILQELQRSWESKVARSRVANFGFKDNGYYEEDNGAVLNETQTAGGPSNVPVSQGNDPAVLQYPSDYPLNTAPPSAASLANLAATATAVAQGNRNLQYGLSLPPPTAATNNNNNTNTMNRMIPDPSTLVNQYPIINSNHKPSNNLSDLQLPGISNNRPNNHLPQNDGAHDDDLLTTEEIDRRIHAIIQENTTEDDKEEEISLSFTASTMSGEPLALDSLPESVKALIRDAKSKKCQRMIDQLDGESDNAQEASAQASSTGNEDDINSDLDDSDDNDEEGEGGEEIEHIILCLYDKVTRTKNKWKCILKDGIMLVNGRDYLFHRANGDFEW
ncbi:transcription factor IIA, alpha/beta subunit [Blakeslea trispora]|nr:transcription factor IIA, alpha/beta subunit [Blakeslea trispora]